MAAAGERQKAIREGKTRYFTGRPCPRGHISERIVSNKSCARCGNEDRAITHAEKIDHERTRARAYYWANAERQRELRRVRGAKNRVAETAYQREWLKANPDKAKEYQRRDHEKRGPKKAEFARAWRKENKDKQRDYSNKKRAILASAVPDISDEMIPFFNAEILAVYSEARMLGELTGVRHDVDHVFPLSKGGVHAPWNLRVITRSANQSKKDKWPKGEAVHVIWHGEIVSRIKETI